MPAPPLPHRPVAALAFMVGAVLYKLNHAPFVWFGLGAMVAALVYGLPGAFEHPRMQRMREFFARHRLATLEVLAILVFVALVSAEQWDTAFGSRPVNHDHPVHYFKAWQLKEHLLPEGRLRGWSPRIAAGYPANYLYPFGADLWVNFVHILGLGLVSFSSAYGLAIWAFSILSLYAVYRLGRVYVGWGAGLLAGVFFHMDVGSFRYGGYTNTLLWGVWPQALGVAWCCLALAEIPKLLERRDPSAWGRLALFIGLGLISHPASILMLAMALPPALIGILALDRGKRLGAAIRYGLAGVCGIVAGGLYLFPFFDTKEFVKAKGKPWLDAMQMAEAVYDASIMRGSGWFFVALGLLGLLLLLRRGRWKTWYIAIVMLALFALGNQTFMLGMGEDVTTERFKNVVFERVSILIKPFFFVAAGTTAAYLLRVLRERGDDRRRPVLHAFTVFTAVVLAAPTLERWRVMIVDNHLSKGLTPVEDRPHAKHHAEFVEYAKTLPLEPVSRWMFWYKRSHKYIDQAIPLQAYVYKRMSMPCVVYEYKIAHWSRAVLKASNIRWVMAERKLGRDFELLKRIGPFYIYEFKHWSPDPFEVIEGQGEVELVEWGDEEIVLRAREGAHGKLRLNVSYFSRWQATRDGEPLPIDVVQIGRQRRSALMAVPLAPGEYRFTFTRTPLDYASTVFGLLGFAVALGLAVGPGLRRRWNKSSPRGRPDPARSADA